MDMSAAYWGAVTTHLPKTKIVIDHFHVIGTNNQIKTMKRQAYGFRDMEFFKLKIPAIHETRYELVG